MRAVAMWAGRVLVVGAVLTLGACASVGDMMDNAYHDDGATPGTVPGHLGTPNGPMYNGIMPEPWGSTS